LTNKILIRDSENRIISFDGTNWINTSLIDPLSEDDFKTYGINSTGAISQAKWNEIDDEFDVLMWTDSYLTLNNQNVTVNTISSYKPINLLYNPTLTSYIQDTKDLQLTMNVFANNQLRFLLSNDKRVSWNTFKSGSWQQVNLNQIDTMGMSLTEINSLTSDQLLAWFKRGYIDLAIWLQSQSNDGHECLLKTVLFNFPANTAPVLNNYIVTPNVDGRDNIVIKFDINDLEGDLVSYQILNNGVPLNNLDNSGWSEWIDGSNTVSIQKVFPYTTFSIGNNNITIKVQDNRGKIFTSPIQTLTINNNTPYFSAISHNNWSLNAVITDADGDKIQYRILINDKQVFPKSNSTSAIFTNFYDVPYNLNYNWYSSDLVLGKTNNKVTIEVKDGLGALYSTSFTDIVGKYKNIMFKSADNKYFTDDQGNLIDWGSGLLSYLDLGVVQAGTTTEPVQILVENDYAYPIQNVNVSVNPIGIYGYDVQIAKDTTFCPQGSDTLQSITYNNVVMNDGDTNKLYLRVVTNVFSSSVGGTFELDTRCDIV
jgi:hypothetical protein